MIYGYESRTVNESGLKQMREISLAVSADDLRELADFLRTSAVGRWVQARFGHESCPGRMLDRAEASFGKLAGSVR
jgi:hypothetical protein